MNSSRLKFELIDPQTGARATSAAPPKPQSRPRLVQDLAQGLDFLIGQLSDAETDRDRALEEADRWKSETAKMRTEIADLKREVKAATEGSAEFQAARKTLEGVVAEQQKALLLSMELMSRFETEMSSLRTRVEAVEAAPVPPVEVREESLRELEQLRADLSVAESEHRNKDQRIAELEQKLEAAVRDLTTEKEAATESTEAHRVELESATRGMEQLRADLAAQRESAAKAENAHREELATVNAKLTAALETGARLREELAEYTKMGDPAAAIRALEEQRNIARNEAAAARADVSIQSAEIETKDALIAALERALEQQHGSLRSLEQRFADYATKLQELRIDRLTMPSSVKEDSPLTAKPTSRMRGLLAGFQRTFSPAPKPETPPGMDPREDAGQ